MIITIILQPQDKRFSLHLNENLSISQFGGVLLKYLPKLQMATNHKYFIFHRGLVLMENSDLTVGDLFAKVKVLTVVDEAFARVFWKSENGQLMETVFMNGYEN